MESNKNLIKRLFFFIFLFSNILCIDPNLDNLMQGYNIIDNNLLKSDNVIEADLDKFIRGQIKNDEKIINYKFNIENNSENDSLIFDYQSEFGCLYISYNSLKVNKTYCSEGRNELFILELEKKISDTNMFVGVGYKDREFNPDFKFNYSLKVSFNKRLNITEINSKHKVSCSMEKVDDYYRCLFVIKNEEKLKEDDELIIFPLPNADLGDFYIYADYINKDDYYELNKTELEKLIPNENSEYTNKRINKTNLSYIKITSFNNSRYIFVSLESKKQTMIEMVSQIVDKTKSLVFPKEFDNNIRVFSIKNDNENINIKVQIEHSYFSNYLDLKFTAISGKGYITDKLVFNRNKYIIDSNDNNLYFSFNSYKCNTYDKKDACEYNVYKLEEEFIFYITYSFIEEKDDVNEKMNELLYGKSNKYISPDQINNIELYEYIPNIKKPINANLQLYNKVVKTSSYYNIKAFVLSPKDLQNIKMNSSEINKYSPKVEKKFQLITLATNIYIPKEDLDNDDSYILLVLDSQKTFANDGIILGVTISQEDSLIYPSERIYHFGEMNSVDGKKVVYRLQGNVDKKLMRLEFGHNSPDIKWSVKRTNSDKYKTNDTDLSFVTEYFCNGRELLTMYIEKGEDIYLTIFKEKSFQTDNNKTLKHNFAFKYVNSQKNGDFKNYIVKDDYLTYEIEERKIKINLLQSVSNAKYYMRIIPKQNYIDSENLNSISLIESDGSILYTEITNTDINEYYIKNIIDKYADYEVNCYIAVIDDNNDVELLSYQRLDLNKLEIEKASTGLIIAAICLACVAFVIFIIRLIHHCCCIEDYYGSKKNKKKSYY